MLLVNMKITKYGLSSPGVLGLELLWQSRRRSRPAAIASPSTPRSEVIQNPSNLVAQMKSAVQPEHGNYALCLQAQKAMQRILDRVLQPEPYDSNDSLADQRLQVDMLPDVARDQLDWLSTKSELDLHPLLTKTYTLSTYVE